MGQILALPFDVQKLPGFRFRTLPPDPLTGVPLCRAGALPQSKFEEAMVYARFAYSFPTNLILAHDVVRETVSYGALGYMPPRLS